MRLTGRLWPIYEQNLKDMKRIADTVGGSVDPAFVLTAIQGLVQEDTKVILELDDDGKIVFSVRGSGGTARVVGDSLADAVALIVCWKKGQEVTP